MLEELLSVLLHLLELFALPTRVGFVVCQVQLILCLGALRDFVLTVLGLSFVPCTTRQHFSNLC